VRIALDTNMLAYAEGVNGLERKRTAKAILARLPQDSLVLPVQVLGELCAVLVRRYLLTEDMQDGFRWRGITIANPFASSLPPPLTALLNHFP
jgi:predicted nucleic acid-binding protein